MKLVLSASHLYNLNRKYFQIAAESSFQTLKMKPSSSEKTTFSNKVEQRAVIKLCVDIGKTPTETHKFIKQSVTHSNVSRSLPVRFKLI
jgi:hypothetical protein